MRVEGAVLLIGPQRVRVVEGVLEVLGARVAEGGEFVVPAGRRIPAYADNAVVEAGRVEQLGSGEYERLDGVASELAKAGRIMLLGPSDSGKSTMAAWIYNKSGTDRILVTLDVGQNEVYMPGFAASARPSRPAIPGSMDSPAGACFVGAFSPSKALARYIACASSLALDGNPVVDTDGWVAPGRGIESKLLVAEAMRATRVLAIGVGMDVARLLEAVGLDVVWLERVARAEKSREERRLHRDRLIASKLAGGRVKPYSIAETPVVGLPVFNGSPLDREAVRDLDPRAVYGEVQGDELVLVSRNRVRRPGVRVLRPGWEEGLLVALKPRQGLPVPGVVTRIDYQRRRLMVYSNSHPDDVRLIEAGVDRVDLKPFMGKV